MSAVELLLASSCVLGASILLVALAPNRGSLAALLGVGLWAWASVATIVGFAGLVIRDLSGPTLLGLAIAELAAMLVVARRRALSRADLVRGWRSTLRTLAPVARWTPTAIAGVLAAASLLWRALLAVRLPVVDVLGWQYHLVTVDVWLQSNQIVRVTQNIWTDGWPAAGELLTTWLMAFSRTDALAGFTGLLPLPIAMVATASLARSLGARRPTALLAGLVLGMVPALVVLAGTSYPDTGTAAAAVATWSLGLRWLRGERNAWTAALLGIAAGLAIGTKGTSVVLVGPIVAVVGLTLIVALVRGRGQAGGSRRGVLLHAAALAVPVALLGASWYLKNVVVHGNPIYPIGIGPFVGPAAPGSFGAPPLPAVLGSAGRFEQIARSWAWDVHLRAYPYNVRPGGFGLAWLPILGLGGIGAALLVRRRRWAPAILVVAVGAGALLILPSPWYARYTLFLPPIALALAAIALDWLRPIARTGAAIGLVGLAAVSLVLADARPNLPIPLSKGLVGESVAYLRLVLTAGDAARADVGLRAECGAFEVIPDGARVAVDSGFFVPHAAVGADLQRVLTEPVSPADIPAGLAQAMGTRHADWLVAVAGNPLDVAARAAGVFEDRGLMCRGGHLWHYAPG